MKKIVSTIAIIILAATMFAACGEKAPEIVGTPYDHKNFTLTIPEGWNAKEEMGVLTIKKTDTQLMLIIVKDDNTDPIDMIMKEMTKENPDIKFEDVTIGGNSFKKFEMTQGQKSTNLLFAKDKLAMLITTGDNFSGAEEQGIIASLKLK